MTSTPLYDLCLIIDDDEDVLLSARFVVEELFREVITLTSPREALALIERKQPDVVLLDANFARGATDGSEGFLWLGRMIERDPAIAIVLITAHGGVQIAVEAMKRGATDFVSKPWNNESLLATVRNAAALHRSRREAGGTASRPGGESSLLGQSPAMARVLSLIEKAAPTQANILILGENGTGKELVAREVHRQSRRAEASLLTVDLGAVAESLFDSELFGHVKGAFTDARADRVGRLQAAEGGTVFLDEVGNLPLHLQPKLLTALEQRKVTPVGASKPIDIDVRVLSATNMAPAQLADESRFRKDLLFRLNTVEIRLPPLRERPEDIPLLLDHYLSEFARSYDKPQRALPAEVLARLRAYSWPGNVRELRHAAERAVILGDERGFSMADFALAETPVSAHGVVLAAPSLETDASADDLNLDRAERRLIERALHKHGYNISHAAAELGLTRATLYRRMERHGL
ncbi:sigma-54 dependent transcriptional regulator [Novosphingobium sp.]|uniref:sigma-54-dependent transcriptional regulator n=1 Tax=Novosphingobium sp. TaxID=1874826 RepID=UPI0031CFBB1F